jgi:integrase
VASIRRRNGRYQVRGEGIRPRTFTLHADAKLYKADQERRKALGELYVAAPETFGACLDAYLERSQPSWRPKTYRNRLEEAKYLKPLRTLSTKDVTRAELEDLVYGVATHAPRMSQMALALAKAVLRDCQARRVPIDLACLTIPPPRYEPRQAEFLNTTQLYELASRMPDFIGRIVLIAGLTGMRQGELLDLSVDDLDLNHKRLEVRKGKTAAAARTVYLNDLLVKLLREQLVARPAKATPYVFSAPEGGKLGASNLMSRYFRPAREAAGMTLPFHALRHSAISLMAVAGWQPAHIARQVGHTDGGALLLRKYRHVFEGEMEAQPAKLDTLMEAGT